MRTALYLCKFVGNIYLSHKLVKRDFIVYINNVYLIAMLLFYSTLFV